MTAPRDDELKGYTEILRDHVGSVHGLPDLEGEVALGALRGESVQEIAQEMASMKRLSGTCSRA